MQIEHCHTLGRQQRFGLTKGKTETGPAIAYGIGEDLLQKSSGQARKIAVPGIKGLCPHLRQCRLALDIGNGVPQRGEALLAIRG